MKTKDIIKLSAVIDKMDIRKEMNSIDGKTNEEIGTQIITLFISKLYKAEDEIYDFISSYKNITKEEAMEIDIVALLKELLKIDGIQGFLS